MAQWFRLYESMLDDPKVQRLPDGLFKAWVNMLCLACRNDGWLPPKEDIAFALRKSERDIERIITDLDTAGLLDWNTEHDRYRPHNWDTRQYKSDVSNERVKRHRERQRNVTSNGNETPSESETDTETDTEEEKGESAQARSPTPKPNAEEPTTDDAKPKRGHRLPDDWQASPALDDFARDLGLNPPDVWPKFIDHWRAAAGANARKLDWDAAARNWCRREAGQHANRPQGVRAARDASEAGAFYRAGVRLGSG